LISEMMFSAAISILSIFLVDFTLLDVFKNYFFTLYFR